MCFLGFVPQDVRFHKLILTLNPNMKDSVSLGGIVILCGETILSSVSFQGLYQIVSMLMKIIPNYCVNQLPGEDFIAEYMKRPIQRSSSTSSVESHGDGDGHDVENVGDGEDEETLRDFDAFKRWLGENGISDSSPVDTPAASPGESSTTSKPVDSTLCKVCRKKSCILHLFWINICLFWDGIVSTN